MNRQETKIIQRTSFLLFEEYECSNWEHLSGGKALNNNSEEKKLFLVHLKMYK